MEGGVKVSGFIRTDTTANRIRIAMNKAGKKQIDIVRETGIDKGSMSHYLKGKYEPKQDTMYILAKNLNVSEMWLWGYDCPMERPDDQKKNDIQTDIVLRMRSDENFMEAVTYMYNLDDEKLESVKQLLITFQK